MQAPIQEYHLFLTTDRIESFYTEGCGKQNLLHPTRVLGSQDSQWLTLKIFIDNDTNPKIFHAPRCECRFWGSPEIKQAVCARIEHQSNIITDGPKYSCIVEYQ